MTDGAQRSGGPLAALSESLVLRLSAFTALYAAQGLPYGLLSVAVPAHMAERGFSPAAIGSFIGITLLPWSLKLVNGPIMDRWSFLPMGRRRPWVLVAQAGMVVSSVAIAFLPNPLDHLGWLTALGFAINFFTAFQDVAVDGMAIDIIPVNQQARANGFMWGGKTLGYLRGGGRRCVDDERLRAWRGIARPRVSNWVGHADPAADTGTAR